MSTKLYEGLALRDSAQSPFAVVRAIATPVREAFLEEARILVAEELVRTLDSPKLRESIEHSPLQTATERWRANQARESTRSTFHDPLRFSLVLGEAISGRILAYPFYARSSYRAALESTGIFEDYHYQNQTDRPEELTEVEWNQRSEDWDSVLSSDGTLGELPGWQLGDSQDPFGAVSLELLRGELDLNSYHSPESRRLSMVQDALFTAALDSGLGDREFPLRILVPVREASRELAAELPLPEPIDADAALELSELVPYELSPEELQRGLETLAKRLS